MDPNTPPSSDSVTSVNGALVTAIAASTTAPTPENTPIPGGGSWHWDYPSACWVENPPYGVEPPATTPADPAPRPSSTQPTSE